MVLEEKKNTKLVNVETSHKNTKLSAFNNLPIISNGSIEAYISFVNSVPLLTPQEEYDFAEKWRIDEDVESARYLVLSHLRLVVSISRTYLGYGLPLADIIQEGTIGLMKAVKRFDARRKVRLVTFAIHWIRAEINEYVIKNWRIVKTVTTKSQRKLFFNLRSQRKDIGMLSENEAENIAKELNVSREEVVDMNMRLTGNDVGLISENSEGFSPIDWLHDEEHMPDQMLMKKSEDRLHTEGIDFALQQLDDRSQDIIKARWLTDPEDQSTLVDLGKKYNVSAERIRQIESNAMQKMKAILVEYSS